MLNILAFGSCRLKFNLNKYELNTVKNLEFIHNHYEILDIINSLHNNLLNENILTKTSKIIKEIFLINNLNNTKNIFFKQIETSDIILMEICSKMIYYEYNIYENNEYKILSHYDRLKDFIDNYIKIMNTSQTRDYSMTTYYSRKDNIFLSNKILYNFIKLGNYSSNKEFYELTYNEESKESIIKLINMPNNSFESFNISFDIHFDNTKKYSYTVKLDISCDSDKDIFIKYYNGSEYIYTDQKIQDNITLENFKARYAIGFYRKNDIGEIMTNDMLKETNEFYWNINFNIKSYEIIINELENIDITLPKQIIAYKKNENDFINSFNDFVNNFKNKKIIVVSNLAIKDNNEEKYQNM